MNPTLAAMTIGYLGIYSGQPQSWNVAPEMIFGWQEFEPEFHVLPGLFKAHASPPYRLQPVEEEIFYRALRRSTRVIRKGNRAS